MYESVDVSTTILPLEVATDGSTACSVTIAGLDVAVAEVVEATVSSTTD